MNQRQRLRNTSSQLTLLALFFLGVYVVLVVREANDLDEQLERERGRRLEAEAQTRKKAQQVDQALEHIHEKSNGDDQPAGE